MIGTEFLEGQGLGNQLLCYVSARCIAMDNGKEFGTAGQERLAVNRHSKKGLYFMDLDLGKPVTDTSGFTVFREAEKRIYRRTCVHDMKHGCYVSGGDQRVYEIKDQTLLYGNFQSELYFRHHLHEIRQWLAVKPEYESDEFTKDNLCILNFRGGEYEGEPALYLSKKYWINAMNYMKSINPTMEFMIVTDDVAAANKMLPDIPACHGELAKDYVTIKNARYLILSNSSFGILPALLSTTAKVILAPEYWARHNVSDGYWASEQNIYEKFSYVNRNGDILSGNHCRQALEFYRQKAKNERQRPYSKAAIYLRGVLERLQYLGGKAKRKLKG